MTFKAYSVPRVIVHGKNALADACTLTNPRQTSAEDIKKIYQAAYYGQKIDF